MELQPCARLGAIVILGCRPVGARLRRTGEDPDISRALGQESGFASAVSSALALAHGRLVRRSRPDGIESPSKALLLPIVGPETFSAFSQISKYAPIIS